MQLALKPTEAYELALLQPFGSTDVSMRGERATDGRRSRLVR